MTNLKLAGIIALILNGIGALLNWLSFRSSNSLLIKLNTFGGEITIEHGFGGIRAVHIYGMTPDQLTTHSVQFSPVGFVISFLLTLAVVYLILLVLRRVRTAS